MLGLTVGYGYRPWLAGVWLLVPVGFGWGIFQFVFPYPQYFTAAQSMAVPRTFNRFCTALTWSSPS
jgi:hypothetical protein